MPAEVSCSIRLADIRAGGGPDVRTSRFSKETTVTVDLARKAAEAAERVRRSGIRSSRKDDGTPVTQADIVSQAIILAGLRDHFPDDRIEAEETLSSDRRDALRTSACDLLRELGLERACGDLERLVNYRGNPAGRRAWMIDPIDGTKGFERGLSYAIAIGLYFEGRPGFGCLAAPRFPGGDGSGGRTVIAYAGRGEGAYWLEGGEVRGRPVHVSDIGDLSRLRMVGSRAHDLDDICGTLVSKAGIRQLIRMDGQGKYLMLASGRADLYVRSADPDYGIAFTWDHCAGQIILEEAGGRVTDWDGKPIDYAPPPGRPITNLEGLVAGNGKCHEEILRILREIRESKAKGDP
jgi:3'(2'), 5'-bisphosphate nucleotidase